MVRPKGRPPIDPYIKAVIRRVACVDRQAPRKDVASKVREELSAMGVPAPTPLTLMNEISRARKFQTEPIDEPWSVGSIVQHPIPAEVLPVVLEVQLRFPCLSIREAMWVARLSTLVDKLSKDPQSEKRDSLFVWAVIYAAEEQVCNVANLPFDTRILDRVLVNAWEICSTKDISANDRISYVLGKEAWPDDKALRESQERRGKAMGLGWILSQIWKTQFLKVADDKKEQEGKQRVAAMERIQPYSVKVKGGK